MVRLADKPRMTVGTNKQRDALETSQLLYNAVLEERSGALTKAMLRIGFALNIPAGDCDSGDNGVLTANVVKSRSTSD